MAIHKSKGCTWYINHIIHMRQIGSSVGHKSLACLISADPSRMLGECVGETLYHRQRQRQRQRSRQGETDNPPTPADGRGSAPEKDWRMLPVRPSGPCCFAVARRPFLSCAVSAFIVLPFWARRHWEHVLASCVRPSGSCCFGICSKS